MFSQTDSRVPLHHGLAALAGDYDAFIVDLWGVMHDGVRAFPEALACLAELKARGKRIWILSNAPRRAASVAARNLELGIPPEHVDGVLSSGEAAWRHLAERPDPWYQALGRCCYHLGPARDQGMRDGLDYDFLDDDFLNRPGDLAVADFLLNTGALSAAHAVEHYAPLLDEALARGLPMVCANPDLEVIRGGRREICAGAIALAYERRGGQVRYHGKPHREIYQDCFALMAAAGPVEPARILAIGDSLRTDIAGAQACGIDGLFVAGGIHAEALGLVDGQSPDGTRLAALFADRGLYPVAVLSRLRW